MRTPSKPRTTHEPRYCDYFACYATEAPCPYLAHSKYRPAVSPPPDGIGELLERFYDREPMELTPGGQKCFAGDNDYKEAWTAELSALITTQPGAGTTLPTSPQTDTVTEGFATGADNATPPELGELRDDVAKLAGQNVGQIDRKITDILNSDRSRIQRKLLDRVGEDEYVPTLSESWGKYDIGAIKARNEYRAGLRATIAAVFGSGE